MAKETEAAKDDLQQDDAVIVDDTFTIGADDIEEEADADDKGGKADGEEKGKGKEKEGLLEDDPAAIKSELERLRADKNNLKKALHEERQAKKKAKTEDTSEVQLTDSQLLAIMKEHQDEPETMLNIMKHIAKQTATGVKKDALSEAEVRNRTKQAETFLKERIPQLYEDGSDVRSNVDRVRDELGLPEDPMSDYLAAGVIALNRTPELAEYWYNKGKSDALGQKNREKEIRDGSAAPAGKSGNKPKVAMSKDMDDLANQMGLTPSQRKLYAKLRTAKGASSISMED